jgi:nucleotide-binding universal stress UspA family protein
MLRPPKMIESLLVATDGSETAGTAVERAAALAHAVGASAHVMTAYQPLRAHVAPGAAVDPEVADWAVRSDARAEAILDRACAAFRLHGVEAQPHSHRGDAADGILEVAERLEVDLVVVGNKGLTGARRFLLGSVPNKVSHHATCSVLIVQTT